MYNKSVNIATGTPPGTLILDPANDAQGPGSGIALKPNQFFRVHTLGYSGGISTTLTILSGKDTQTTLRTIVSPAGGINLVEPAAIDGGIIDLPNNTPLYGQASASFYVNIGYSVQGLG